MLDNRGIRPKTHAWCMHLARKALRNFYKLNPHCKVTKKEARKIIFRYSKTTRLDLKNPKRNFENEQWLQVVIDDVLEQLYKDARSDPMLIITEMIYTARYYSEKVTGKANIDFCKRREHNLTSILNYIQYEKGVDILSW